MQLDISQDTILKKFKAYQALIKGVEGADAIFNVGKCHGFSICSGVMSVLNKKVWWESLLGEISRWDESQETLVQKIKLPGAEEEASLDTLIQRAFHYVLSMYDGTPFVANQSEILLPDGLLEMLDSDNQLRKVVDRVVAFGSPAQLIDLIEQEVGDTENCFCLLNNATHCCTLRYENKRWYYYNANNKSGERVFQNKAQVIKKITHSLPSNEGNLGLEIASFRGNFSKKLHKICSNTLAPAEGINLGSERWKFILDYAPSQLQQWYAFAMTHCSIREDIARQLSLQRSNNCKWTGFHQVARYAPDGLLTLLLLAKESPEVLISIASALTMQNNNGWTGFHMLVRFLPNGLPALLTLAKESPAVLVSIASTLTIISNEGVTGLYMIVRYAPKSLPALLALAKESPEFLESLAKALIFQDTQGWTGFHMVAYFATECLSALITLAKESPILLSSLASTLNLQGGDAWTGFHIVARYAPESLPIFLELAKESPEILISIASALTMQNKDGWTGFHMVVKFSPNSLPALLTLAEKSPELLSRLANVLNLQENTNGLMGFHMVVDSVSESVPKLLVLATKSSEVLSSLSNALNCSSNDGRTGFYMIVRNAPMSLPALFALAKESPELLASLTNTLSLANSDGITGLRMAVSYAPDSLVVLLALAKEFPGLQASFEESFMKSFMLNNELQHAHDLGVFVNNIPESDRLYYVSLLVHQVKVRGTLLFLRDKLSDSDRMSFTELLYATSNKSVSPSIKFFSNVSLNQQNKNLLNNNVDKGFIAYIVSKLDMFVQFIDNSELHELRKSEQKMPNLRNQFAEKIRSNGQGALTRASMIAACKNYPVLERVFDEHKWQLSDESLVDADMLINLLSHRIKQLIEEKSNKRKYEC